MPITVRISPTSIGPVNPDAPVISVSITIIKAIVITVVRTIVITKTETGMGRAMRCDVAAVAMLAMVFALAIVLLAIVLALVALRAGMGLPVISAAIAAVVSQYG